MGVCGRALRVAAGAPRDGVAAARRRPNIFTLGPMGSRGKGRALFMLDPDGNETEVNTRYLYGVPKR